MLDASVPECPWCSTPFAPGQAVCSSCGANLAADDRAAIPGVTEIDKAAVGVARPPAITNRSRWRAWISGDSSDALTASEAKAVAPPDNAVRQEMLRLELLAQVARLQAETDALLAEAAEEGRKIDIPPELLSTAMADPTDAAVSAELTDAAVSAEPADAVASVEPSDAAAAAEHAESAEPAATPEPAGAAESAGVDGSARAEESVGADTRS